MPKHVGRPARYRATPLYKLRKEIGGETPITQQALAKLIGAALPTLKWHGRRKISDALLQKIRFATGATWELEKKRWLFDSWLLGSFDGPERFVPFTQGLFNQYRHAFMAHPQNTTEHLIFMQSALNQLFARVEADRWMELYYRYMSFIERSWNEFELGHPRELFLGAIIERCNWLAQNNDNELGRDAREVAHRMSTILAKLKTKGRADTATHSPVSSRGE